MDPSSEFLALELPFAANDREEDERVYYGELVMEVAPKATTLLADHLFSPSLLLAERLELGLVPLAYKTVLELGAGCALPSLLAATFAPPSSTAPPRLVLATDYPSPIILDTLRKNIQQNSHVVRAGCVLGYEGFEWGNEEDLKRVKRWLDGHQVPEAGFDILILSDLLHFSSSHTELVNSVVALLKRDGEARVYVAAGMCSPPCLNSIKFELMPSLIVPFRKLYRSREGKVSGEWLGELCVRGLTKDDMGARKGKCWWWAGRWGAGAYSDVTRNDQKKTAGTA
ncbi:hypothetical protein BU17DRAFT_78324 [Hysterangium stoloniferum]|nr:hypothetical protein BU17DRAFT_78324 [Hysterangium stoloniferum]